MPVVGDVVCRGKTSGGGRAQDVGGLKISDSHVFSVFADGNEEPRQKQDAV